MGQFGKIRLLQRLWRSLEKSF